MHNEFLTTSQVARELGVSVTRVNALARRGRLQVEHKGTGRTAARLFTPEAVAAFKRSRERAA